ncbi:hypothetical protein [Leptothoe sp. PORK10 BA2]|uniref:hypothetical protein n=1 Tax=Leptothoe sp. PORK10 BA2 TaxID=3110254 RepID=UPI002B20189F|nr:hypothetical protein [Leptothoe sp. PORK10 BA2]MEA5463687.1 hypothetical protein [Leptothoe sp. PORK10 BA2]
MPTSSPHAKQPKALALKQAANWQCKACGKLCRRPNESLGDFAVRSGHEAEVIAAHPRRWTLHVTKNYKPESIVLDPDNAKKKAPKKKNKKSSNQSVVVLCGSCHRTYHNYRRWQRHQQQHHQQQEHMGQLTLSDIRPPLTGLQLSLNDWGTPYEIVNPQSPRRRLKAPKATSDFN